MASKALPPPAPVEWPRWEKGADCCGGLASPRTLALTAASRVPLPPTPRDGPPAPAPPKAKPGKNKHKSGGVGSAAPRPVAAPKAKAAGPAPAPPPDASARLARTRAWAASVPALLALATYAGTAIFLMCFYILAPASRLVNWWRGTPAWSAARLVEEQGGDEHPPPPDPARAALVASLLRLHGDGSLSAATAINPEFQWWVADLDTPGVGLEGAIPFVVAAGYGRRVSMAVGDPVADPAHWPALAAAFIAARPDAQFWHASAAFAGVLDKLGGFYVNDFGAETVIDLRVRRGREQSARARATFSVA